MSYSVLWRRNLSSFKNTSALKRPVIDFRGILDRSEEMRKSLKRRNLDERDLDKMEELRKESIVLQHQRDGFVHERKKLEALIPQSKAMEGKEREELLSYVKKAVKEFKPVIQEAEELLSTVNKDLYTYGEALPNWLDPSVPEDPNEPELVNYIKGDSENAIVERYPPSLTDHKYIGEKLGIMNFSVASRIAGSSWYYLVGDGALLEQALVQYALSKARRAGYQMVIPPSIVKSEITNACGFKPRDQNGEKQVYSLEGEPLSLTGTAEIPLGALHSSSNMKPNQWPVKYVGVSRSYRAEAGANGRDTTGLYRVHEFTKVELFHFTTQERSAAELEELREFQTSIIDELGLSARVLNMPTTDLGAPAMKKYDIEAWMPGRKAWGELTSCSNCGDYQSRRLGIRYSPQANEKAAFVHTLNGTAMAVPRVIVALLEQNYNPKTETVTIPEVLRPYMDGKECIRRDPSICT